MKKKRVEHVFRKTIYLLGKDEEGINYWLESPSWDCNWYWGFGYVETYTNNRSPQNSRDIQSHSHSRVGDYSEKADYSIFKTDLVELTINSIERTKLIELFKQFYILRKQADAAHQNDPLIWFKLNSIDIPFVMNQIIAILTPEKEQKFEVVSTGDIENMSFKIV